MWLFNVPLAFLFTQILVLPPIWAFAGCRLYYFLRAILGTVMLHKVKWINRLTEH
jgi:Na+-driven multidrug efflux pump